MNKSSFWIPAIPHLTEGREGGERERRERERERGERGKEERERGEREREGEREEREREGRREEEGEKEGERGKKLENHLPVAAHSGKRVKEMGSPLTVRLTMVPNFSKWLLSFVMVFDSRGIFLTIRVSDGCRGTNGCECCGRGQCECECECGGGGGK